MKFIFRIIFLLFLFFYDDQLKPILDGRTGNFPIELDTVYTFSRFEWARGYVIFQEGFDVPPGGTIFLGIDQFVNGTVNLNGGTIILEKNLTLYPDFALTGSGFFKTNNYAFCFEGDLNLTNTYYFSNRVTFNGMGTGALNVSDESHIVLDTSRVEFENLTLNLEAEADHFTFTSVAQDRIFVLNNVSINLTGTLELERLITRGQSSIHGFDSLFTALKDVLVSTGDFSADFGTRLESRSLATSSNNIYLDSVALSIRNGIFPFLAFTGVGNVFIDGKCFLDSKNTPTVESSTGVDLILRSNARLIVQPDTYLKI